MKFRHFLHSVTRGLALCLSSLSAASALEAAPRERQLFLDHPQSLALPSQSLSNALIELGKASGISIIFPSQLLSPYNLHNQAQAIEGELTARETLEIWLAETELSYREISPRVIAIIPRPAEPADDDQPAPPSIEELTVLGVSVTGSRLSRTDLQGTSPVDIISAPDLSRSGHQSLGEFLKFVPSVSGNSTSTAVSNGGDGTATVTLRGLPANNTLVLINGQRVAFDGMAGDSVDLNSIPTSAIDRIEILKDGASAIYGSDAIAGVINIIMKQEFDGLQVEQYVGESSRGDLQTATTNLLWGLTGERGSLIASASYYSQDGLYSRQRALSDNADGRALGGIDNRTSATPDSRITLPDGPVVTPLADGSYRPATDEDLYNYRSQTSAISPSERLAVYLAGHYQLNDKLRAHADVTYSSTEATISLASVPIYTAFEDVPLIVSSDNIYNPFGEDILDIRRRLIELPSREQENRSDNLRLNLGLSGQTNTRELSLNWQGNLYWSRSNARESLNHLLDGQRVQRALGGADQCRGISIDGCEPLNLFGPAGSIDADQLAYIETSAITEGYSQLFGTNLSFDTTLLELDSGPLMMAGGIDLRRERSSLVPQNFSPDQFIIGGVSTGETRGQRSVREAYLELQIPLLYQRPGIYSLDLEAALRHSYYSDFGHNTTPKLGLRYRPSMDLLLRSTFSRGFRAPSLDELHKGGYQTHAFLEDPCSQPANIGVLPGCQQPSDATRNQFLTEFRGDSDLKPEESRSYTLGLVWTPLAIPGLLVSADYFHIEQENVVDASPQTILNENAYFGNFDELVQRDAQGNITRLYAPFINIGERQITGVDLALRYQWNSPRYGSFTSSLNASHLSSFINKVTDNSAAIDMAGRFSDAATEGYGSLPQWKANTGLVWQYQDLEVSYSLNYISSLKEHIPMGVEQRNIDAWLTHDLQLSYYLPLQSGLQVTIGADNLFDKAPPFAASAFNDNFDGHTYDIRRRFWYLKLSQRF